MMGKVKILLTILAFGYCLSISCSVYADDTELKLDSADGTSAFLIQDSSATTMGSIDSDGNLVIKGGMRIDSAGIECTTAENLIVDGNVSVGTGADPSGSGDIEIDGNVVLSGGGAVGPDTTNAISISAVGEPTLIGTARHTRKVTLSPEYAGALLSPVGQGGTASGNNSGVMTADKEMSTNTWRKYYKWISSESGQQDYYILVSWQVPSDFAGFADTNAFQLDYKTKTINLPPCSIDLGIWKDGVGTALYSGLYLYSSSADVWTTLTVDDSSITPAPSANDTLIIEMRLKSYSNNYVYVSNIVINYLSKW